MTGTLAAARATDPPGQTTLIAEAVFRAWTKVLGQESLQDGEPFDAAGGESLGFLRLVHLIEDELKQPLDLERLSMTYTPQELVRAIAGHAEAATSPVPARPLVFMVPIAGGAGPGQAAFRAGCASHLDVQVVSLPHWSNVVEPSYRFDHLVSHVAQEILERAQGQPILLVGYCFGGAVAAAVAQHLYARGHIPRLVGILDGDRMWFASERRYLTSSESWLLIVKSLRWSWQRGQLSQALAQRVANALSGLNRRSLRWLARKGRHHRLPEAFRFHLDLHLQMRLLPSADRAGLIQAMNPSAPLPVPAAVFRTSFHGTDRPADLGWSALFAPTTSHVIQGDHEGIFAAEVVGGLSGAFIRWTQGVLGKTHADGASDSHHVDGVALRRPSPAWHQ